MQNTPSLTQIMPLLNPQYPDGYYDLFMEIKEKIQKKQYTKQLNELIEKVIVFGETNYTCWVAKKRILEAGEISLEEEDIYCQEVLLDNLKNFQVWDYRSYIFELTKNWEREYAIYDKILEESPKNYHLWSNRTKVVDYAKNYIQEINNTEKYIIRDPFNNSAWAYRFYCFQRAGKNVEEIKEQISWVLAIIRQHVQNQAAWNYLRGFFPSHKLKNFSNKNQITSSKIYHIQLKFQDFPEIQNLCKQLISSEKLTPMKQAEILLILSIINSQSEDRIQFAHENINILIQLEPFRRNYYQWLKSSI